MLVLSAEEKENLEIAMVVLEEFKDASDMTDQELEDEEFIGQEIDMDNFGGLIQEPSQSEDLTGLEETKT